MKINYVIKHFIGTFLFFTILFISVGRIDYWQGLIYVFLGLIMTILNYTFLRIDADLIMERSKPGEGTKKWDKIILGLSLLTTIFNFVIAGLDSGRYHWSPYFHWSIYLLGIFLTASGQLLFLIAQKQNKFFSSTARTQIDRKQIVSDLGLCKIVRHPAYMSSIIQSLGFPLLFGSLWSFIPICLMILLLITRTNLEDKTLKNELQGYLEYANRTRYRIIPFVW